MTLMLRNTAELKPDDVVKHFAKHFEEHEYASELYKNAEAYFEDHLHLVTMHVDRQSQKPVTQPLKVFGKWYFQLLRKLLGHRVNHKIKLQPLTYGFIDFEGSRSGAHSMQGPHVHAVLLLHLDTVEQFKKLVAEADLTFGLDQVKDIQFDAFTKGRKSSKHLISYAMKGYSKTSANLSYRENLWSMWPAIKTK